MDSEPPKKKRKLVKDKASFNVNELKILDGMEKSKLIADRVEFWKNKELCVMQLPKNVG